jgi:hypothetical protein
MTDSGWSLQVYQMTDLDSQQSAARLLCDSQAFTVDARSCERGDFLIIESADATRGLDVYVTVMMADAGAELIYSTRQRDEWDDLAKAPLSS